MHVAVATGGGIHFFTIMVQLKFVPCSLYPLTGLKHETSCSFTFSSSLRRKISLYSPQDHNTNEDEVVSNYDKNALCSLNRSHQYLIVGS